MTKWSMWKRLSAALCLYAIAPAALAGDAAYPEALGFSADGKHFAFAEWGQQDGSGFGYANIYTIDLVRDAWISAPVRELVRDEAIPPRRALENARDAAVDQLQQAGITHPARLIYAGSYRAKAQKALEISWQPIAMLNGTPENYTISLTKHEIDTPRCDDAAFGFALIWNDKEIHRDLKLSKSRGCPLDYSIERIFTLEDGGPYAVALIGVFRWGFEGPDLRHIALPLPIN